MQAQFVHTGMSVSAPMAFRLSSLLDFLRDVRQELKEVQWPSRETTIRLAALVIVVSAAAGLATGALDVLLTFIIERLL